MYSSELVTYFEAQGWTCDECKPCIVCDESPSESDKSEVRGGILSINE